MVELVVLQSISYMAGALGVCIAAIYYVMNLRISQKNQEISLRNQELMLKAQEQSANAQQQTLETRQAQLFMNIFDKASNKEFNTSWHRFIIAPFNTWDQFRELYSSDKEFYEAWWVTSMFFEGLGLLVREGLMPIRIVECLVGGMARSYCEKMLLIIDDARKGLGFTRFCDNSMFLYDELMRYFREHPELDTRIEKPLMDMPI